jgi:hypothetical protein
VGSASSGSPASRARTARCSTDEQDEIVQIEQLQAQGVAPDRICGGAVRLQRLCPHSIVRETLPTEHRFRRTDL